MRTQGRQRADWERTSDREDKSSFKTEETGIGDEKAAQSDKTCKRVMVLTVKKSLVTSHIQ